MSNEPKINSRKNMRVDEVVPVELPDFVMPHTCPRCGKAQQPVTLRKREHYRELKCSACANTYWHQAARTFITEPT